MEIEQIWNILTAAYVEHAPGLLKYCAWKMQSREEAEEVVHDAFMHIFEYMRRGNRIEDIRAFLYSVSNNLIIDWSRRKKRKNEKEVCFDELYMNDKDTIADGSDERMAGTFQNRVLAKKLLQECKEQLGELQYEILVMRYMKGMKPAQIAVKTGLTANAVSLRLYRAIKHLNATFARWK